MVSQHGGHPDTPSRPTRDVDCARRVNRYGRQTAQVGIITVDGRPPRTDRATACNREAIRAKLIADGIIGNDAYVVIAGPANTYGHYVTTIEEYRLQRYEGASTIFGPREFL